MRRPAVGEKFCGIPDQMRSAEARRGERLLDRRDTRVAQRGAAIALARIVSVAVGVPCILWTATSGGIVQVAWAFAAQAGVYLLATWIGGKLTHGPPTRTGTQPRSDQTPTQVEGSDRT